MPLITLSDRTFANCVNLKSLYAPALVSYGYQDFYGCTTLTNVTLDGSASFYALSPGNKRAPGNSFANCPAFKDLHWLGQNSPTNKGDHCFSVLTNIQPTDEPVIIRVKNGADRAGWEALCSTLKADLTDAHKLIPNYSKVKGRKLIGYIGHAPKTKTVEGELVLDGQYNSDKGEYAWVVEDSASGLMIYLK